MATFINVLKTLELSELLESTHILINVDHIVSVLQFHGDQADSIYAEITLITGEKIQVNEDIDSFISMLNPVCE